MGRRLGHKHEIPALFARLLTVHLPDACLLCSCPGLAVIPLCFSCACLQFLVIKKSTPIVRSQPSNGEGSGGGPGGLRLAPRGSPCSRTPHARFQGRRWHRLPASGGS